MTAEPFVVSPRTYEPALNVLGVSVTVLASNIQTKGHEITLQSGGEGSGPPLSGVIPAVHPATIPAARWMSSG